MATLDELERVFRADPTLADLLAALDRSAAAVAAAGLTAGDLTTDLPTIRAHVARTAYGDAFMDELHRDIETLRATDTPNVPTDDDLAALDLDDLFDADELATINAQDLDDLVRLDADETASHEIPHVPAAPPTTPT